MAKYYPPPHTPTPPQKYSPKRKAKGAPAAKAQPVRRQEPLHKEEPKREYTLMDCMRIGRTANILFVVFIVICLIYYYSLAKYGNFVIPFEIIAYGIEATAFALFTLSVVWLDRLVRQRLPMKILLVCYIIVEVILMLLEFDFLPFIPYNGLSLALTLCHVIFSGGVALSLLMLAPESKKLQTVVIIHSVLILAGMFLGLAGYRVYASILLNAFAYIFFFTAMIHLIRNEDVDIDCYGDKAKVTDFSSTMFSDSPVLKEPVKETVSEKLRKKALLVADKLTPRANPVETLTDDAEFEYEFGVDEYEEDEDDYDEEQDV
ncbi:MAG: hypothetical protein IJC75_03050 [Oscillospiraceae bacterium]|nr:hypothetical protein [Oscillospiraceae bacterium]